MRLQVCTASLLVALAGFALAASKPHVILFGKWTTVRLFSGPEENHPVELKVRSLFVDGKLREYTFGLPHEITEQLFVVRRILRVNDDLPDEPPTNPHWTWQRDGWLAVDRETGHSSLVNLPDFDPDDSSAAWYRGYVAYCGVSDDGQKLLAVIMHVGRRKPVLRKALGENSDEAHGAPQCVLPVWQRRPARVTFTTPADHAFTFIVRGRSIATVSEGEDDETGTE